MCYQLPALMSEGTAIVVSPLIALMKNQLILFVGYLKMTGLHMYSIRHLQKPPLIK